MKVLNVRIKDETGGTQSIRIEAHDRSILICPEGYGEKSAKDGEGAPIMIEKYDGKLRVIVWSDINLEDPTHTIEMEGAKEDNRKVETVPETP
jgi:hypothetical protein